MTSQIEGRDPDAAVALFRGESQPLLLVRRQELTAKMLRRAALRDQPWQVLGPTPRRRRPRLWILDHLARRARNVQPSI